MFWKPGQLQVRPGRLVSGTGPVSGRQQTRNLGGRGFYKLLSQPREGEGGQGASPQGRLDLGVANAITHLEFSLGDETGQRGQA